MSDENTLRIEGNVTRQPELTQVNANSVVTKVSIASHRHFPLEREGEKITKWGEKTSFVDVDAWNVVGENIFSDVNVGDKVRFTGRVEQDRWVGEGGNRSRLKMVATGFEVTRRKGA